LHERADKSAISRARKLRENATGAERKLWAELRALRRQGFHFRRQAPFQKYTLDFVDHGAKLVIELDGGQHAETKHRQRDRVRDDLLEREGYYTIRIWNGGVDTDMNGVMETIHRVLKMRRDGVPQSKLPKRWKE
jgi:very-short-patch-repair endonuclease